jgi:hypothetical protein
MAERLELQTKLVELLGSDNVYFQPTSAHRLSYPCIVYSTDDRPVKRADNAVHVYSVRYQVTFISQDPDSDIPKKLALLPLCSFERTYTQENLIHEVFNLFF